MASGALASRGRAALPDAVLADPALSFISYMSQRDNDSPFGKPDARAVMGTEAGWHLTRARCPVNPGGLRATARRVAARPGHSQALGPLRRARPPGAEFRWQPQPCISTELSGSERRGRVRARGFWALQPWERHSCLRIKCVTKNPEKGAQFCHVLAC